MNWAPDASARYERWRSQWLSGTDSQALATFRWHGLAVTLALTAPPAAPVRADRLAGPAGRDACPSAALAEAARQIRALLRSQEDTCHA